MLCPGRLFEHGVEHLLDQTPAILGRHVGIGQTGEVDAIWIIGWRDAFEAVDHAWKERGEVLLNDELSVDADIPANLLRYDLPPSTEVTTASVEATVVEDAADEDMLTPDTE